MRLREVVRAKKNKVEWGDWHKGPTPRKEFPLSRFRAKHYSLGPTYRWRICKFSIGDQPFRVWILYRLDIEKYHAYLGEERDGDMHVLCRYEFHGTHEGWHAHAACHEDSSVISPGRGQHPALRRIPSAQSPHRSTMFHIDNERATLIAVQAYGLHRLSEPQSDLFA